jgi:Uma2 family endonuclease
MGLLATYSWETPGTMGLGRVTVILGPRSEVEPDTMLLIRPECGGWTRIDDEGMMVGCPELVVEIADDTLQLDLYDKKYAYEDAGDGEYLMLNVRNPGFRWFVHRDGRFEPLPRDGDGIYRSRIFPGLWLETEPFLNNDHRAVMVTLRRGLESAEHADFVEQLRQNRANRP